MNDLIEALQIFAKYANNEFPTSCEHDVLYVLVDPSLVSVEDTSKLESLGFSADTAEECFHSFRYGSA